MIFCEILIGNILKGKMFVKRKKEAGRRKKISISSSGNVKLEMQNGCNTYKGNPYATTLMSSIGHQKAIISEPKHLKWFNLKNVFEETSRFCGSREEGNIHALLSLYPSG